MKAAVRILAGLLTFAPAMAPGQSPPPTATPQAAAAAPAAPAFKPEEIEALVAPIALYPDPLLSQVLMASTYPLEVVQAARWVKANPKVQGDAALKAVEGQKWDVSVKSLVAFPQVLEPMNGKNRIRRIHQTRERWRTSSSRLEMASTRQKTPSTSGTRKNSSRIRRPPQVGPCRGPGRRGTSGAAAA